jgi:predicted GIY-YIG superfamily endonuclease
LEESDFWGPLRPDELNLEYPDFCAQCRYVALVDAGRVGVNPDHPPENRPIASHAQVVRRVRYVYLLKLSDGRFYVGQTSDLTIRLQEHRDGTQRQTKGKDPRLVYYESFEGNRDSVNEREAELAKMNQNGFGRRRLRQMIERFRGPLRLLDLEA